MRKSKGKGLKNDKTDWRSKPFKDRQSKVNDSVVQFCQKCIRPNPEATRQVTYSELYGIYTEFCAITPEIDNKVFFDERLFIFHLRVLLPFNFQKRRKVTREERLQGVEGVFIPAHFHSLETIRDWFDPPVERYLSFGDLIQKNVRTGGLMEFAYFETTVKSHESKNT